MADFAPDDPADEVARALAQDQLQERNEQNAELRREGDLDARIAETLSRHQDPGPA